MPFLVHQPLTLDQHLARAERLQALPSLNKFDKARLDESLKALKVWTKEQQALLKRQDPLGNANLSYYQTLKLNSWLGGHLFLVDFDCNRGGKTAASIIRIHIFCNPPPSGAAIWKSKQELNPLTSSQPHPYQLLPPPPIGIVYNISADDPLRRLDLYKSHLHPDNLLTWLEAVRASPMLRHLKDEIDRKTGIWTPRSSLSDSTNLKASYDTLHSANLNLEKPLPSEHVVWHGAPDHGKFKQVCAKGWHEWSPPGDAWIKRYVEHEGLIDITYPSRISLRIVAKSYDSPAEKFASDAVRFILLTEAPTVDQWTEIGLRFEYPALGSWDYTVADPSNTNSGAHYAEQVFKKKEHLPLNPIVFQGFGLDFVPRHILTDKKRADLIAKYSNKPEGQARIFGKFYSTTPRALSNLDRTLHCIPSSLSEIRRHKFNKFDKDPFLYFRGYDEGIDSPSACVWGALAPDNTWYIYRAWAKADMSIGQRCKEIIALSGNERKARHPGRTPAAGYRTDYVNTDVFFKEEMKSERIVMTIADYHLFKRDQNTGRTHALNYTKEGLLLRASITAGPEERVLLLNKMLEPYVPNELIPLSGRFGLYDDDEKPQPRARIYFLMNEPGVADMVDHFEEWYWERYVQGENKGQPKDKVADKDDHLADALSYMVLSPFRWSPHLASSGYASQFQSAPDAKYSIELKDALEDLLLQRLVS